MWHLQPPTHTARDVYRTCISNADPANAAILNQYEESVVQAAERYEAACRDQQLHTLDSADFRPPQSPQTALHASKLEDVYTQRLAGAKGPGRAIYDELRSQTPFGRCPLCGHGTVSTLDHHLPKTKYQFLAVTPTNLLPACADCNKLKSDAAPSVAEDQTLHPYFDDVEQDEWLAATIFEEAPCVVQFTVLPPGHWPPLLAARVRKHFVTFRLGHVYSAQAANELAGMNLLFTQLAAKGPLVLHSFLSEIAESHAEHRRNDWKVATYRALAASEWFCSGGFASS